MSPVKLLTVDRHCSVLGRWIAEGIRNATLIHIDAHADAAGLTPDEIHSIGSGEAQVTALERDTAFFSQDGVMDLENYVQVAARLGIVRKVIWVRPDFCATNQGRTQVVRSVFREQGLGITAEEWRHWREDRVGVQLRVGGVVWHHCSIEEVRISSGERLLVDVDADYFGLEGSLSPPALQALWRLCGHRQTALVTLAWSREGGFTTPELRRRLEAWLDGFGPGELQRFSLDETSFPTGCHLRHEDREAYANALYSLRGSGYAQAASLLRPLVGTYPKIAGFHYTLGLAQRRLGELQEAELHFRTAAELAPWCHTVLNDLGTLLMENGRLDDALDLLAAAERARPGMKETPYNTGLALLGLGRREEAAHCFEETLRRQPVYARAAYMLGISLTRSGRRSAARKVFTEALQLAEGRLRSVMQRALEQTREP